MKSMNGGKLFDLASSTSYYVGCSTNESQKWIMSYNSTTKMVCGTASCSAPGKHQFIVYHGTAIRGRATTYVTPGTAVSSKHSIAVFGDNTNHQLGVAATTVQTPTNLLVSALTDGETVTKIASNGLTTFMLTDFGRVLAMGKNPASISTTLSGIVDYTPTGYHMMDISSGNYGTLMADSTGHLWQFLGTSGTLTKIENTNYDDEWVTQVCAGYDHALMLDDDNDVLAIGKNDYNQALGKAASALTSWTDISEDGGSEIVGEDIIAIYCGKHISFLIEHGYDDGYVFGHNLEGRGGADTDHYNLAAQEVDNIDPTKVASGLDFTAFIARGALYTAGNENDGKSARGTCKDDSTNDPEATGISVKDIAAGDNHGLYVTSTNEVYSFGMSDNYQTGTGTTAQSCVNTRVAYGSAVFAQGDSSLVVNPHKVSVGSTGELQAVPAFPGSPTIQLETSAGSALGTFSKAHSGAVYRYRGANFTMPAGDYSLKLIYGTAEYWMPMAFTTGFTVSPPAVNTRDSYFALLGDDGRSATKVVTNANYTFNLCLKNFDNNKAAHTLSGDYNVTLHLSGSSFADVTTTWPLSTMTVNGTGLQCRKFNSSSLFAVGSSGSVTVVPVLTKADETVFMDAMTLKYDDIYIRKDAADMPRLAVLAVVSLLALLL
ncbi:Regulator of chromosome condensation (RCC1) repeat [Carpediemonas membranifera]|uniref:Regulator of chromosome condensation (RCC1) repeat n=1 Tax=Carpediemonas membranifera TaxID=201153 RepID=A0A8J6E0X5_9EUKA|nr:Regulator of chromosome condensation (RCC1) repeat [Carpediemonas membranifera]|eukprot:KAG9392396.1 Regulator of chromosome condensation (RCC1) repeat [Carpediemonas membranifera]